VKCPKNGGVNPPPPPPPPEPIQIVKEIKKLTADLTRCTNAIRSGRNVKEQKELGNKIMAKASTIINSLSDGEKKKQQVQDAIKLYKLAEQGYKMQK